MQLPTRLHYYKRGGISASEGREELHFEFSYITLLCLWFQMMAHNHLHLEHPEHDVAIAVSSLELDMGIPSMWSLLTGHFTSSFPHNELFHSVASVALFDPHLRSMDKADQIIPLNSFDFTVLW